MLTIDIETKIQCDIDTELAVQMAEESCTIIHFTYKTSSKYDSGWWINIHKTAYIVNTESNERLQMLHAINIPIAPQKVFLKKYGDKIGFTLIFPKVPDSWNYFNFVESCTGLNGFFISRIQRNNSSVYRLKI